MSHKALRILYLGQTFILTFTFICLAIIPTDFIGHYLTICIFKNLFGKECLGCGMIRAISSILHGNLVPAISYNKLVVIFFPILCLILIGNMVSIFLSFKRNRKLTLHPQANFKVGEF